MDEWRRSPGSGAWRKRAGAAFGRRGSDLCDARRDADAAIEALLEALQRADPMARLEQAWSGAERRTSLSTSLPAGQADAPWSSAISGRARNAKRRRGTGHGTGERWLQAQGVARLRTDGPGLNLIRLDSSVATHFLSIDGTACSGLDAWA